MSVKKCQSSRVAEGYNLSHEDICSWLDQPFALPSSLLASSVEFYAQRRRRLRRSGANAGMANSQADGRRRVRRHRSHSELDEEKAHKSRGREKAALEPDVSEVRRIRIERLESQTSNDRTAAASKMTSESHATLSTQKSPSSHRRRKEHHRSGEEKSHRRRRKSPSRDDSTYVYGNPESNSKQSRIKIAEKELGIADESSESEEEERSTRVESVNDRPRKRKIKIVYITEEDYQSKPKERSIREKKPRDDHKDSDAFVRRSKTHHSHRKSSAEGPPPSPPRRYDVTDSIFSKQLD